MSQKLPFDNKIIANLSFLEMPSSISSEEVAFIAKQLPSVFPEEELDNLQTEVS